MNTAGDAGLGLLCYCLRLSGIDRTKLMSQLAQVGWDHLFETADSERLGSALVQAICNRELAPPIPAVTLPDGRLTAPAALAQRWDDHVHRRATLLERLDELARALNEAGIIPVVLKGGRSLCTGGPEWRSLRDLDLLVPGAAVRAQKVARAIGYREGSAPISRLFHHHQQELYRNDLPGWIEIHQRAGLSRVEQFLGSAELARAAAEIVLPGGGRVGILPIHLHVLHSMLHHHIGHDGVRLKAISPKGLFEFAAELASFTADERRSLIEKSVGTPACSPSSSSGAPPRQTSTDSPLNRRCNHLPIRATGGAECATARRLPAAHGRS